jgi:hypothetical protein
MTRSLLLLAELSARELKNWIRIRLFGIGNDQRWKGLLSLLGATFWIVALGWVLFARVSRGEEFVQRAVLVIFVIRSCNAALSLLSREGPRYSGAEVQWLFRAPLARQALLGYRLLARFSRNIRSAAFFLLIGFFTIPDAGKFLVCVSLFLITMSAEETALSMIGAQVSAKLARFARSVLGMALAAALVLPVVPHLVTALESAHADPFELATLAASRDPMILVLHGPAVLLSAAAFAEGWADSVPALLGTTGLLAAFVLLAMFLDRSYRDSAALGAWTGTPLDVMREQSRATPWYRRPPWPSVMQGPAALVWKGFLRLLRESPVHILILPVIVSGVFFIASRPRSPDHAYLSLVSGSAVVLLLLMLTGAALHGVHDLLIFRRLGFSPFALGFGTLSAAVVRAWIAIAPLAWLASETLPRVASATTLLGVLTIAAAVPHVLVCGRFLPVASLWLRYRMWYFSWLSPLVAQLVLLLVLASALIPLLPALLVPGLMSALSSLLPPALAATAVDHAPELGLLVACVCYATLAVPMLWLHGLMLMSLDMEALIRIQGEEEKK